VHSWNLKQGKLAQVEFDILMRGSDFGVVCNNGAIFNAFFSITGMV